MARVRNRLRSRPSIGGRPTIGQGGRREAGGYGRAEQFAYANPVSGASEGAGGVDETVYDWRLNGMGQ